MTYYCSFMAADLEVIERPSYWYNIHR